MELVSVIVGPASVLIALVGLGIGFWAGRAAFGQKRLAEKDLTLTAYPMRCRTAFLVSKALLLSIPRFLRSRWT
jgi:hypothetical protein